MAPYLTKRSITFFEKNKFYSIENSLSKTIPFKTRCLANNLIHLKSSLKMLWWIDFNRICMMIRETISERSHEVSIYKTIPWILNLFGDDVKMLHYIYINYISTYVTIMDFIKSYINTCNDIELDDIPT